MLIDRLTYRSKEGNHVQIFLVLEESLVLRAVSSMLGMPLKKVDRMVENTVRSGVEQQTVIKVLCIKDLSELFRRHQVIALQFVWKMH